MNTDKYTLTDEENDKLRELINTAINVAASEDGSAQFAVEHRIYFNVSTREFGTAVVGVSDNCTTGWEEEGYTFLCDVEEFAAEHLDEVGPDPADELLDATLEQARRNLEEEEMQELYSA